MQSIETKTYNSSNLAISLSNDFTDQYSIANKRQYIYLEEYLNELDAKTILIEKEYVSKAYLSDFAFYYSKCFDTPPSKCVRVHFFNRAFTKSDFVNDVLNKRKKYFNHYLGYVVVKPIPLFVIGPTLLKTYPNKKGNRKRIFFGTREYTVNILGEKIKLNSLVFQEQDKVISACATTALWSSMHKAAKLFDLTVSRPSEITQKAGITASGGGRLFPNRGLSTKQMCDIIFKSGLVTEIRHHESRYQPSTSYIKQIIYAYAKTGIPIILNIEVPNDESEEFGAHAVAVCGYKMKNRITKKPPSDKISLLSDEIEKIYVHDDQWGPFSRIIIQDQSLISSWTTFDDEERPTHSSEILVPIYPSIRISYDDVLSVVYGIDAILRLAFEDVSLTDFQWDIHIVNSNEYKNEIKYSKLNSSVKRKVLDKSMPKYVWRAICIIENDKIYEYLFDSTALSNSMYGIYAIGYYEILNEFITNFLELNGGLCSEFEHENCVDFIEFMKFI